MSSATSAGASVRWHVAPSGPASSVGLAAPEADDRLFPAPSVEGHPRRPADRPFVHAAQVHADSLRVRAREVEGLHAAVATEGVSRRAGIEPVRRAETLQIGEFKNIAQQLFNPDKGYGI